MNKSFAKIVIFVFAAAGMMLTGCGNDEPGNDNGPGSSANKTSHAVRHRLKSIDRIYGSGAKKTVFSNLIYDKEGRLEGYEGQFGYIYTYHYYKDKIEVMLGRDHNSTNLERGYSLEKGRISDNCRYDKNNRLIAMVNVPLSYGLARYDIEWTGGNITKITITKESNGDVMDVIRISYSDIPCESLVACMGYLADKSSPNPYRYLYHIDPVLVEEGYYGNSMVENLWSGFETLGDHDEIVQHKFRWENFTNDVPGYLLHTWDPSGVEKFWYTWDD